MWLSALVECLVSGTTTSSPSLSPPAEWGRGWWKGVKCHKIGEDVCFWVVHVLTSGFDLALICWCTVGCCSPCQQAPNYTEWEFPAGTLTRLYFLTCGCTPETKRAALLVQYVRSLYCSFCKALALCQKQDLGLWKRNKIWLCLINVWGIETWAVVRSFRDPDLQIQSFPPHLKNFKQLRKDGPLFCSPLSHGRSFCRLLTVQR